MSVDFNVLRAILEAREAGIHVERFGDIEIPDEAPRMALDPLLLDEGPSVLFGPGETFKTIIAQVAATSIGTGQELVEGWVPAMSGPVLWLDYEANRRRLARRQRRLPAAPIIYVPCHKPIWDMVDTLASLRSGTGAEAIVVDSIGFATTGVSLKDPESAIQYYTAVNAICQRSLSLGHVPKDRPDDHYPFGSIYFHNGANLTWGTHVDDKDKGHVTLTNHKCSDEDRRPAIGLAISFADGHLRVDHRSPQLTPDVLGAIAMRLGGAVTGDELRDAAVREGYVFGRSWFFLLLKRAVEGGCVTKLSRDLYEPTRGPTRGLTVLEEAAS